jgi:hypothetical protein
MLPTFQQLAAGAAAQRRLLIALQARVQGFAAGAVPLTLLRAGPTGASVAHLTTQQQQQQQQMVLREGLTWKFRAGE